MLYLFLYTEPTCPRAGSSNPSNVSADAGAEKKANEVGIDGRIGGSDLSLSIYEPQDGNDKGRCRP